MEFKIAHTIWFKNFSIFEPKCRGDFQIHRGEARSKMSLANHYHWGIKKCSFCTFEISFKILQFSRHDFFSRPFLLAKATKKTGLSFFSFGGSADRHKKSEKNRLRRFFSDFLCRSADPPLLKKNFTYFFSGFCKLRRCFFLHCFQLSAYFHIFHRFVAFHVVFDRDQNASRQPSTIFFNVKGFTMFSMSRIVQVFNLL